MNAVGLMEKDTCCFSIVVKSHNLPGAGQRGGGTEGRWILQTRVCRLGKQAGVRVGLSSLRLELLAPAAAMTERAGGTTTPEDEGTLCTVVAFRGVGLLSRLFEFPASEGQGEEGRRGQEAVEKARLEEGLAGREEGRVWMDRGTEPGGRTGGFCQGVFRVVSGGGGGRRTRRRWQCRGHHTHTAHEPTPTRTTHTAASVARKAARQCRDSAEGGGRTWRGGTAEGTVRGRDGDADWMERETWAHFPVRWQKLLRSVRTVKSRSHFQTEAMLHYRNRTQVRGRHSI